MSEGAIDDYWDKIELPLAHRSDAGYDEGSAHIVTLRARTNNIQADEDFQDISRAESNHICAVPPSSGA